MGHRQARRIYLLTGWVAASVLLGAIGWGLYFNGARDAVPPAIPDPTTIASKEPVTPLPLTLSLDPDKVKLGGRLFGDPKLSSDGQVSCAHCHNLATGGVDRLPFSNGIGGRQGHINAPTVFNSGFNFRQFWDGRAATLEDQIDGPLQNPLEMGNSWPKTLATLEADADYRSKFSALYPDGIQALNVKDAIATFERSLVTPNARFDRFLRGDLTALNEQEQAGYRLFKRIGCTSCHQGMGIGGNLYQKLGIMEDYFSVRGHITEADGGRFNLTGQEEDRHFFKVPSLRNVAVTPPYLHDGSARTLKDVVGIMVRFQLGTKLDATETGELVAFLKTLTGEYQGRSLE